MNSSRSCSADHSHTAASAYLFDAGDEVAIRQNIIALRFHHHHEIPGTFHVKQYSCLAFALLEKRVEIVHGRLSRGFEGDANAKRARQGDLGFLQRHDLGGGYFWIRSFFNSYSRPHQHWDFQLHLILQTLVSFKEDDHIEFARHV